MSENHDRNLFTASQWHIFRAVLLCVLFLLTLILPRESGNIVDELAVSVVCINNMDPMPALPEILNLATDPGSSGVIKHLPPPHPFKFRRSG